MTFRVDSVNISARKGTAKTAVAEIQLVEHFGIAGDGHAGPGHRQVSLLAAEAVDIMKAQGLELLPGAFGENILTRGMDWTTARIGGTITIGDVILEVTQIGKECHTPCAIFQAAGQCIMPTRGIFAKVIRGGCIHVQDSGDYRI